MSVLDETPTRILVVDDQDDVRFLIRTILDDAPGLAVAGEAADGERALEQIEVLVPDVMILDARMPGLDGLQTAARILATRPEQVIVLCSAAADPGVWRRAREAGIAACVSKDDFFSLPDVVRGCRSG